MVEKIDRSKSCWVWEGAIDGCGYGVYNHKKAHRLVYELYRGPIPKGLHIDHLCRNRPCVRPDHLDAVPNKVNVLRGIGTGAKFARRTHCNKGHEFTKENTQIRSDGGRRCVICKKENDRARDNRPDGITRWNRMTHDQKKRAQKTHQKWMDNRTPEQHRIMLDKMITYKSIRKHKKIHI